MVDTLVAKTRAWEDDKSMSFEYDGVPLLAMLDEYTILRQEREEEKRRQKVSFSHCCCVYIISYKLIFAFV